MPNTVPNQRLVAIHRERASSDFLGIKNSHWQAAARDLGAHALMLYLYFASNANGFMLALSPAAIRQAVGMPSSTYRDQFVRLVDKGYLVQRGDSNTYDFYETPQRATHTEKDETDGGYDFTADAFGTPQTVNNDTPEDREININKRNCSFPALLPAHLCLPASGPGRTPGNHSELDGARRCGHDGALSACSERGQGRCGTETEFAIQKRKTDPSHCVRRSVQVQFKYGGFLP